jgi:hypothetical protein
MNGTDDKVYQPLCTDFSIGHKKSYKKKFVQLP